MKTFKLIGMALLAILMCANFTACSDDDNPKEEITNSELKLLIGNWDMAKTSNNLYITSSFTFKSDFTYSYTYAEDGDSDTVYRGKFTFDADKHKITCYEGNSNLVDREWFIVEVNSAH